MGEVGEIHVTPAVIRLAVDAREITFGVVDDAGYRQTVNDKMPIFARLLPVKTAGGLLVACSHECPLMLQSA